jgi:hypothetical protein
VPQWTSLINKTLDYIMKLLWLSSQWLCRRYVFISFSRGRSIRVFQLYSSTSGFIKIISISSFSRFIPPLIIKDNKHIKNYIRSRTGRYFYKRRWVSIITWLNTIPVFIIHRKYFLIYLLLFTKIEIVNLYIIKI